jgi:hypothetical protein
MLLAHPTGHYRFLAGIEPYSCGVIADPGYQIVRVALASPLPWRRGFARLEDHLRGAGRNREDLCGVELRSPAPFTMSGFVAFNRTYCEVLRAWGVYVGDQNPVARTNVAPVHQPPAEVVLHAFSYIAPAIVPTRPTLVVAGAGELREGLLEEERIIRPGEDSAEALREKATYVMQVMTDRLRGLGGDWSLVTAVNVYTARLEAWVAEEVVLAGAEPACRAGLCWHCTRPPVQQIDFEMDLRGIATELVI